MPLWGADLPLWGGEFWEEPLWWPPFPKPPVDLEWSGQQTVSLRLGLAGGRDVVIGSFSRSFSDFLFNTFSVRGLSP